MLITRKSIAALLLLCSSVLVFGQEVEKVVDFEKGAWHVGVTMNIKNENEENVDNIILNVDVDDDDRFEFNVSGGYFVADYMSAGLKYGYLKKERDLQYNSDGEVAHYQSAKSKHVAVAFLRNYFPISANNRFSFFNETDLEFGFGNTLTRHQKSEAEITKTYADEFNVKLGLKPGVAVVLTKGFAFETAIELLGLNYTRNKITKNGVQEGYENNLNFDFDISLLALDFGLAYYF